MGDIDIKYKALRALLWRTTTNDECAGIAQHDSEITACSNEKIWQHMRNAYRFEVAAATYFLIEVAAATYFLIEVAAATSHNHA